MACSVAWPVDACGMHYSWCSTGLAEGLVSGDLMGAIVVWHGDS